MKKFTVAVLSIFACSVLALSGAAAFHAQKTTAAAETSPSPLAQGTTLISPASYEEYLHLTSPSDVSVSEHYTAIADGNVIYVYDKEDGVYLAYEHSENGEADKNTVTKLQFDDENKLYFLDASTYLYTLDVRDLRSESVCRPIATGFSCSSFVVSGEDIYFTNVSSSTAQISCTALDNLTISSAKTVVGGLSGNPTLTFYGDELYYTSGSVLWKVNGAGEKSDVAFFPESSWFSSMVISENTLFYTDNEQNFYAYNLPDLANAGNARNVTPLAQSSGGYSALALYGREVYTVKGNSVRTFSLENCAFTDFEICNGSSTAHRLNAAAELCLVGDRLLIADNGNARISVYDKGNEQFQSPVPNTLAARFLTSDGETVLVANDKEARLYSLGQKNYAALLATFNNFSGNVVGAACVYGKYYFATDNYCHYVATQQNGAWQLTKTERSQKRTAELLTSDPYGYLFVASGNSVYRYTEEEFLSVTEEGELLHDNLPAQTKKLHVDYAGNVYALSEGKVFQLGKNEPYPLNTPLVYTDTATVQAFAFGIEENETYVLYAEDYLAKTDILDLPTIKNIPVQNAAEKIFSATAADFTVIKTKADALIVEFDVEKLQESTVFPYLSYERKKQSFTALKIAEAAPYSVLAVYDPDTKSYKTCLILTSLCEETPLNNFTQYTEKKTGYLTNGLSLYKYPYMEKLPTVCKMPQDATVTLLGEVSNLDCSYYLVEYVDENGATQTGYIPTSYVTPFHGTPAATQTVTYGDPTGDTDSVWRLAYLVLGAGAICILVDYLILKKRDKE